MYTYIYIWVRIVDITREDKAQYKISVVEMKSSEKMLGVTRKEWL